jgi:hypothetical protein
VCESVQRAKKRSPPASELGAADVKKPARGAELDVDKAQCADWMQKIHELHLTGPKYEPGFGPALARIAMVCLPDPTNVCRSKRRRRGLHLVADSAENLCRSSRRTCGPWWRRRLPYPARRSAQMMPARRRSSWPRSRASCRPK